MPFAGFKDFDACLASMRKKYKKAGVAEKVCGSLKAKHEKKMELAEVKQLIKKEREDLQFIRTELEKKKKKWLQKAAKSIEKKGTGGDFTSWCKSHGHGGVSQGCINAAAKAGGHAAKMALFAANASKGKYTYPKSKK